jgi:hypothetical protein
VKESSINLFAKKMINWRFHHHHHHTKKKFGRVISAKESSINPNSDPILSNS